MRQLPHNPDPSLATEWRRRVAAALEAGATLRPEALRRKQGSFFAERAEQLAAAADLDYLFDGDPGTLAERIRNGVSEYLLSLELGRTGTAPEVRRWFFAALAIDDRGAAHALAAVPRRCWSGADLPRAQAECGFALLRGEEKLASGHLETLQGLTLEQPLPKKFQPDAAEHASWCAIFEGLIRRKAAVMQEGLRQRLEARARSLSDRPSPDRADAIDLEGLGICRLAGLRSIPVSVNHVTLPPGVGTPTSSARP